MSKDVIFRRGKLDIEIETIAESIHHIYCQYCSEVLGVEYWTKGNYDLLNEETKEANRYVARFIRDKYINHQRKDSGGRLSCEAGNPSEIETDGTFQSRLKGTINTFSKENGSDTPDFILAQFLVDCLTVFDKAVKKRSGWYTSTSVIEASCVQTDGEIADDGHIAG